MEEQRIESSQSTRSHSQGEDTTDRRGEDGGESENHKCKSGGFSGGEI